MSRAAAKETTQELTTYVALLRGINVGGKNKLPMTELSAIFVQSGCFNVQTYIQSGNVIFKSAGAKGLADRVAEVIDMRFGFEAPVVMRTAEEWSVIAKTHPLAKSHAEPDSLHVAFLAHRPDERRVTALDPTRSPGDSLLVRDREVYLLLPNGVAKSKLTNAYFDSALGTTCTIRNWRTVQAIADMLQGARLGAA